MAGDKKIAQAEPVAAGFKSDGCALSEQEVAARKDGIPIDATIPFSGDAISTIKGETDQKPVAEQGVYYPPTSCYDYHYPGYGGTFNQLDGHNYLNANGGSYNGIQSDNGSQLYYLPGYNPYATGTFMGVDGQQSYFPSSGYGSDPMPCYSWDSTYVGDVNHGTNAPWSMKSGLGSNASGKSNGFGSRKPTNTFNGKTSNLPLDMKSRQSTVSSNISKSMLQNHHLKSVNKFASSYQSAGLVKGYQPVGNFSPYTNQNQGFFAHNGPLNYNSNTRVWSDNDRFKLREKSYRSGESETSAELTRGPRGHNNTKPTNSPVNDEKQGLSSHKGQYNLDEFTTEYENAKFYVIKSYSEDDVHKCIKYDVWSSTPNGNKKLDAAFQDAEGRTSEIGASCPIFLFFSVNASGQFVGVAEMIGRVDFDKNMDFWQLDKWNGFFPVKWRIIKDIPNTQLRHIILENNDNRPVTYTRDTQEVGLKQGLEMLNIFKSYSAKTSLLDDFHFYENREKLLKAKRSSKPALPTEMYSTKDLTKTLNTGERIIGVPLAVNNSSSDPTSTLIDLTRNLSLSSHTLKTGAEKSLPSVSASE